MYREKLEFEENKIPVRCFVNSSNRQKMEVHPHWHNYVEILFLEKGLAQIQIEDERFKVNEGDIIIISSEKVHAVYSYNDKTSFKVMIIDTEFFLGNSYQMTKSIKEMFAYRIKYPNKITKKHSIYKSLLESYINAYKMQISDNSLQIKAYLNIIKLIFLLYENYNTLIDDRRFIKSKRSRLALKKLFDYIDENYSKDITLKEAAKICGYSQAQFCRLIRHATALSFNEYLTQYRLLKALKLIDEGEQMTKAAYEVGFKSYSSFFRAFKKRYKVSCREYFDNR